MRLENRAAHQLSKHWACRPSSLQTIFGGDAPEGWGGQSGTWAGRFEPCSREPDFIDTVAWSGCPQQALHRQSSLIWSHVAARRCITEQELRLLNRHFFQAGRCLCVCSSRSTRPLHSRVGRTTSAPGSFLKRIYRVSSTGHIVSDRVHIEPSVK